MAGNYVLLTVTNIGSGTAPEVIARAFEPLYTTKAAGVGTGLGLSQVYGFAKQSAGYLKIYSEPDEGTTVKMYLPRCVGQQGSVADDAWAKVLWVGLNLDNTDLDTAGIRACPIRRCGSAATPG